MSSLVEFIEMEGEESGKRVLAAAHSGVKNPVQGGGGEQSWSRTSLQKMRVKLRGDLI